MMETIHPLSEPTFSSETSETIVDDETVVTWVREQLAPSMAGCYTQDEHGRKITVFEVFRLANLADVARVAEAKSKLTMTEKTLSAGLFINPTHRRFGVRPGEVWLERSYEMIGEPVGCYHGDSWIRIGVLGPVNIWKITPGDGEEPLSVTITSVMQVLREIDLVMSVEGTLENVPLRGKVADWWNRFSGGRYFRFLLGSRRDDSRNEQTYRELMKVLNMIDVWRLS